MYVKSKALDLAIRAMKEGRRDVIFEYDFRDLIEAMVAQQKKSTG